ncbi:ankyrin repeat domain-containing protein [Planococcus shenhongbingii]|uniref:Ankyrin repeat domain-containing protein n=1 Tax=Planococcus shenhongbingii TaxID=3058398 RepID=A0ABT8ND03_9BACL|nr:ankyrin repeat domain-containing protein [Planococcus sp. N017]MDN7245557.1 ankyrin repeat domain-containing protein [Planococcus sp. N017]
MKNRAMMKRMKKQRGEMVWAIFYGQTDKVRKLIRKGADVNEADDSGFTPLRWAVQEGQLDIVQLLLSHGADINAIDEEGQTPLYQAAADGNSELVEYLLDNGADIDLSGDGVTPLIIASCYFDSNQLETVKLLVERGADIHAKDNEGQTALFYAEEYGIDDVTSFLKEQGAS